MLKLACGLALASIVACGPGAVRPPVEPPPADAHRALIQEKVQPYLDHALVHSVVVGVLVNGRTEVYGFASPGAGTAPGADAVFEIGSVTKTFTGVLLADMVERGEVRADDPVVGLVPPGVTLPTRAGVVMTLEHLVSHRSGLPRLPPAIVARAPAVDPYGAYTDDMLWADLVRTELEATPGTVMTYSNYGAGLLGRLLAGKLGVPYAEAVRTRVLAPLGLANTIVTVPAGRRLAIVAGHDELGAVRPFWTWKALAGAGALRSTAPDLLAFVQANLDALAGGRAPLAEALRRSLSTVAADEDGGIAYGWMKDRDGRFWHNGGTGGFSSYVGFDPSHNLGVVVLSSTANDQIDLLGLTLLRELAGQAVAPMRLPSPASFDRLVGRYDFQGAAIRVHQDGLRLLATGAEGETYRLMPVGPAEFALQAINAIVVFSLPDGAAKATQLVFVVGGREAIATRIPD